MKLSIFNIGKVLTGDIAAPVAAGDTIVMSDGKILSIGTGGNLRIGVAMSPTA